MKKENLKADILNQKNSQQLKPNQINSQHQFFSNNIIMNNYITIENNDYGNQHHSHSILIQQF